MIQVQNKVSGMLGLASKAGKICFGVDATCEAIEKQIAKLVIIAKDASENTAKKIEKLSKEKNIKYFSYLRKSFSEPGLICTRVE